MSISGPSALGTLLVQRLDAVLGTTLSQQTNLASGARPDAVSQPGQPLSPDPAQNQTARDARSTVDKALEQSGRQLRQTAEKTKLDAQQSILAARNQPATSSTPSAPTSLGSAARAILALLQSFPERAPALAGKSPLLGADPKAALTQAGTPAQGAQPAPGTAAGATANQAGSPNGGTVSSGGQTPANASTAGNAASGVAGTPTPTTAAAHNAAGASVAQFVQALSQTLQNSGLFYESHLSNLAFGKQDAASLHNEPQAHAGRAAAAHQTTQAAPSEAAPRPSGDTAPQQSNPSSPAPAGAAQNSALAGLHPDTHLLVRQQLEVLANQTIAWRGEAWPNAPMQWEVLREKDASEHEGGISHWATRLTLHLPNLGEVQARINLSGREIVMQLIAPESASLLDQNRDVLRTHLLASGLQVSALSVHEHAFSEDKPLQTIGQDSTAPETNP